MNQNLKTNIISNNTFNTGSYLSATDFPNTTTLYGYKASLTNAGFNTVYGGKDLTLVGGGLSPVSSNHIGINSYCTFDGSLDYMTRTDSAFDMTGSFSIGLWIKRSSWSGTGNQKIIARWAPSVGYTLYYYNGSISSYVDGSADIAPVSTIGFDANSWHHIAFVRSNGSYTAMYIDGLLLAKTSSTPTITSNVNVLGIGSRSDGTDKFAGYLDDIWIHNGTAWTSAQVRKIYARGSLSQKAYVGMDGTVQVDLPLEGKWFNWTPTYSPFTGTPTTNIARYMVNKNIVNAIINFTGTTSGSSDRLKLTLPIKTFAYALGGYNIYHLQGTGICTDGGGYLPAMSSTFSGNSGIEIAFFRVDGTNFGGGAGRGVSSSFSYEFDL